MVQETVADPAKTEEQQQKPPPEEAGIAEGDADARQPVEGEEKPEIEEGESQSGKPEGTSGLAEQLKDLSPEAFDALVADLPEEVRESSGYLKEHARRAEQKGRTQAQEEQASDRERMGERTQTYQTFVASARYIDSALDTFGSSSEGLTKALADGDEGAAEKHLKILKGVVGSQDLANAIGGYASGEAQQAVDRSSEHVTGVLGQQAEVLGLIKDGKFIAELTPEEETQFARAKREDAKEPRMRAATVLMGVLIARAERKGHDDGYAKGIKDLDGRQKLADTLKKGQEARNEVAPNVGAGLGPAAGDDAKLLDPNTPVSELMAIRARQAGGR